VILVLSLIFLSAGSRFLRIFLHGSYSNDQAFLPTFYRRVFAPNKIIKILSNGRIGFLVVAYTAMLFPTIFDCTPGAPIYKAWNPTAPGHCFPVRILPHISGILNAVTDIYVLVLPIPTLWGLHLKTSRKIRVMAIFSLGILYELLT
jgi:hypothetical protein